MKQFLWGLSLIAAVAWAQAPATSPTKAHVQAQARLHEMFGKSLPPSGVFALDSSSMHGVHDSSEEELVVPAIVTEEFFGGHASITDPLGMEVDRSTDIVIGTVSKAEAKKNPRGGVSSYFRVRADKVLKGAAESTITVVSRGGSVVLPSGHVRHYVFSNEAYPQAGLRYVLFLRKADQGSDYYIVNAHELTQDGGAIGIHDTKGESRKPADSFLAAVQDAIRRVHDASN